MNPEEELEDLPIAKENRRKRGEAERDRQIYNSRLLDVAREEHRKVRDRRRAKVVRDARKKA